VVGWCDIIPSERDVYRHVGVLGIGLLPEFRGRGIGAKLMQKSIDKAKAKGLTRIELTVYERNKNAIALYQKMGFEIEGLKKNGIRIDGVYDNVYMMALLF
jgi:ribosomal protein S18 acetylase RimI-like enzyme